MRAFVGIQLPASLGTQFLKCVRTMREGAEMNIVRPDKIHLTLAFFEDLGQGDIPKVEIALHAAFTDVFSVEVCQLASFSKRGVAAGVLLEAQSGVLTAAVEAFKKSLREQGVPFDDKPFNPHFSLARVRKMHYETAFAKDFAEAQRRFVKQSFEVERVTLYSSNTVAYRKILETELIKPEPPAEETQESTDNC